VPASSRRSVRIVASLALLAILAPACSSSARLLTGPHASFDAYRGLGTWVDIYDHSAWRDPAGAIAAMKARGVRTLYLETSNFSRQSAFVYRSGVAAFIDAAHEAGLSIVAWYLPSFDNVGRDYRRSMAAIEYRTSSGNRFDSFALDIESSEVKDPARRTVRLLDLSVLIRLSAGPQYPLGAIIPSPRALQRRSTYWPGFPYRPLAMLYDAFLPMTYFTWRVSDADGAHRYTASNIDIIRQQTGDPAVPIHVIGGIAGDATPAETAGFVEAVRERGVIGASYYTFPVTTGSDWPLLDAIPANPVQDPVSPIRLSYGGGLGNIPGGDTTHPKEVVFRAGKRSGPWDLVYRGFDVQPGEVSILVNWKPLGEAATTPAGAWGDAQSVSIPEGMLNANGPNYVAFVAQGSFPDWTKWGVRSVGLVPASAASPSLSPSVGPAPSTTASTSPSA
jgi:hypothetical protein